MIFEISKTYVEYDRIVLAHSFLDMYFIGVYIEINFVNRIGFYEL